MLRFLLWSHVLGVVGFYLVLWFRTNPNGGKRETTGRAGSTFDATETNKGRTVSVIVPARNEEHNIRRCVESLLEQDYDDYEVIVVDDGSTDGTPLILDELMASHPHGERLYVLRLRNDLPKGWAGKPHAIHKGTQEAPGDWLLFTDADTWHAPGALQFAMTKALNEGIDLLSLVTKQELPGFWNKVMMPMAYIGITLQYPIKLVNDPQSQVALANGQYILLRRAVYDILGGYARPDLRNTLLDDRDLARIVKKNGFRLQLADGHGLVRVRMYRLLQLIGLPIVTIIPFLLPLLGWLKGGSRRKGDSISTGELYSAALLELGPILAYRRWIDKVLNVPWYYAFTHPLAGALFEGVLAQSTWRVLMRKGVDWRGRHYYSAREETAKAIVRDIIS